MIFKNAFKEVSYAEIYKYFLFDHNYSKKQ